MNYSTSSNIHQNYGKSLHHFSLEQSIEACSQAGFSHIDITWHSYAQSGQPLAGEHWKEFVQTIGKKLQANNCCANQSHTIFYNHQETDKRAFHEEMVLRCLLANDSLSIPHTVMHILRVKDILSEDKKLGMQKNVDYFKRIADLVETHSIKTNIAIENGLTGFYHSAEELLELLYRLDHPQFGICWDTGHANITNQDQEQALKLINDKLLCTHINDNNGKQDQHLLPYFGTVDFTSIMRALHSIHFKGILTLESPGSTIHAPSALRPSLLHLAVETCELLDQEIL